MNKLLQQPFNIPRIFSLMKRLNKSRYWRWYFFEDPRTGVGFCDGLGGFA